MAVHDELFLIMCSHHIKEIIPQKSEPITFIGFTFSNISIIYKKCDEYFPGKSSLISSIDFKVH